MRYHVIGVIGITITAADDTRFSVMNGISHDRHDLRAHVPGDGVRCSAAVFGVANKDGHRRFTRQLSTITDIYGKTAALPS